jgi:hypothetical protein
MKLRLALLQNGPEDKGRAKITCLSDVEGQTVREAKEQFAFINGLTRQNAWDPESLTFHGWPIIQIMDLPHDEEADAATDG